MAADLNERVLLAGKRTLSPEESGRFGLGSMSTEVPYRQVSVVESTWRNAGDPGERISWRIRRYS